MKTIILYSILFIFFGFNSFQKIDSKSFDCTISSPKKTYQLGEAPEIFVSIKNNSKKNINLIKALDGSEDKMRAPFSYFEIEKPEVESYYVFERDCAHTNPLLKQDFISVKPGELFNPYEYIDNKGLVSYSETFNPLLFRFPGVYQIKYYYSTKSNDIDGYIGSYEYEDFFSWNEKKSFLKLFKKVPHIELVSNTIEIEIVE